MIIDMVIRDCGHYGYLPLIIDAETNQELYRGEFKNTPTDALIRCEHEAGRIRKEQNNVS